LVVWPALRAGATLCVVPDEVRPDPARLRQWLVTTGITVAFLPTPMGELLIDQDWSTGPRPALRHLVVGGDRLRRGSRADLPFQLTNVYGPTEATVVSTWAHRSSAAGAPPPIGRPVPGTWVRVTDQHGRPVPVGVPGELQLGGVQVGRGYLADPEETARRFSRDGANRSTYRTGDVVRWRPDGQLEFLHRDDDQVQIRGFRVEPAEAEHHLRQLDDVRDAAVRPWRNGHDETYLAGYVVPARDGVDPDHLLRELAGRLPAHLVPSVCVLLPALPTLDSGKLDRAALPEPDRAAPPPATPAEGPTTALEQRLHDIWAAELGVDRISPDTTFFRLGGSSLTALRLLNRVAAELGRTVGILDFLREPTIRAMARLLENAPAPDPDQPARTPGVPPDAGRTDDGPTAGPDGRDGPAAADGNGAGPAQPARVRGTL
ncbi:MAG TPA: non-ribosomal peptide synthetase, partial [Micromonospora sp.]